MAVERGLLQKLQQKKGEKIKKGQKSALITDGSTPLRFLHCFALIHLGCCGLRGCWGQGAPRVHEEFGREWIRGVGHTVKNLWLVSKNVVFKHTTSVAIGEDKLQSLLVVLLHGFFIFAGLGLEGGHFIFYCHDLQQNRSSFNLQAGSLSLSPAPGLLCNRQGVLNLSQLILRPRLWSPAATATNRVA